MLKEVRWLLVIIVSLLPRESFVQNVMLILELDKIRIRPFALVFVMNGYMRVKVNILILILTLMKMSRFAEKILWFAHLLEKQWNHQDNSVNIWVLKLCHLPNSCPIWEIRMKFYQIYTIMITLAKKWMYPRLKMLNYVSLVNQDKFNN